MKVCAVSKGEWFVESFRFTVFVSGIPDLDGHWWASVTGEEPSLRNANPRQGLLQEEGPVGAVKLSIAAQPFRLDCVFSVRDDQSSAGTEFSHLAHPIDALPSFRSTVAKLVSLEKLLPINRVAFGLILLAPVSDHGSGYALLSEYLSFKLDGASSSEFLYQINRPREVQIGGKPTKVNRLSKWAVAQLKMLAMQRGPENQTVQTAGHIAARGTTSAKLRRCLARRW